MSFIWELTQVPLMFYLAYIFVSRHDICADLLSLAITVVKKIAYHNVKFLRLYCQITGQAIVV